MKSTASCSQSHIRYLKAILFAFSKNIRFLSVAISVLFPFSNLTFAGLAISPAFVELNLDEPRPSGAFLVTNTGDEAVRYRVFLNHFTTGPEGNMIEAQPDEHSLIPWMKFNPKEFSLEPKSSRNIRFVVVPKGKLSVKSYWGFLELESLSVNEAKGKDSHGRSYNVKVLTSIVVPVFATKGKASYIAEIKDTKLIRKDGAASLETILENGGDGHLFAKLTYEILDANLNVVSNGLLAKTYVFPESRRRFLARVDVNLAPGNYTVRISCEAPQLENPITQDSIVKML